MLIFTLRRTELHIGAASYKYLSTVLAQFQRRVFIRYQSYLEFGIRLIVRRSSGKGAVAATAYRAGAKLEEKETYALDENGERIPTIHEGYAARQMERRGLVSERMEQMRC